MNTENTGRPEPVYGRSGRIGLVVPANNSVIEPEMWSVLPSNVAVYATRVRAKGDLTPEAVRLMEHDVEAAIDAIASTGVDVIAYCDMVTTFIMESGWNEAAVERFSAQTGVPTTSAWTSLRDALVSLNVRRLAVGSPYPSTIHAMAAPFFRERGFDVTSDATLDIVAMRDVPTVGRERLLSLVRSLDPGRADAVVLLATDLPTFPWLPELERELGKPVITSNQALLWATLSRIGKQPTKTLGQLFDQRRG